MSSVQKIEAVRFRKLLDACNKQETKLVTSDFPINNCKLSSMLFSYHLLALWPDIKIVGVSGRTKNHQGEDVISHHWIEVDDIAIDLTADQYNLIEDSILNKKIIKKSPYQAIHLEHKNTTFQHKLFRTVDLNTYTVGFSDVGEDFIEDMERGYSQLIALE